MRAAMILVLLVNTAQVYKTYSKPCKSQFGRGGGGQLDDAASHEGWS